MTGAVEAAPNAGAAFARALFEEWARAGLEHVCICPGSRSGPLAIAAAASPLRHSVHLDERSAGFFALGLARATQVPVVLLCTSGTAAANFAPAVIEAHYARVPLVVLTADRPTEVREWGAGQTIDQQRLFGSHVRWFAEVAEPSARPERLRYARALASRAAELARGRPPGPVHLNLPFRDPLDPRPVPGEVPQDLAERDPCAARGRGAAPYTRVQRGRAEPDPEAVEHLAAELADAERGVVFCGPLDGDETLGRAVVQLAARLGWPLLAEALSVARRTPPTSDAPPIATASWLLGNRHFAESHRPDRVLRFGASPTHKAVARWLNEVPVHIAVDPDELWHDAGHRAAERWCVAPEPLCSALLERLPEPPAPSAWARDFADAERRAAAALATQLEADESLLEPRLVGELAAALPDDALLYVSSSMPVRDLDALWPDDAPVPRVLCNRGANGIDGMVSSALGAAATGARVVLLCGDLALLHDASGLLSARRFDLKLTLVVVDNDGGGIFSMLPVADFPEEARFREIFRTPHGHDLVALSAGAGVPATRVTSWSHFRAALKESLAAAGPRTLVVPCDADASLACRRGLARAVDTALRAET